MPLHGAAPAESRAPRSRTTRCARSSWSRRAPRSPRPPGRTRRCAGMEVRAAALLATLGYRRGRPTPGDEYRDVTQVRAADGRLPSDRAPRERVTRALLPYSLAWAPAPPRRQRRSSERGRALQLVAPHVRARGGARRRVRDARRALLPGRLGDVRAARHVFVHAATRRSARRARRTRRSPSSSRARGRHRPPAASRARRAPPRARRRAAQRRRPPPPPRRRPPPRRSRVPPPAPIPDRDAVRPPLLGGAGVGHEQGGAPAVPKARPARVALPARVDRADDDWRR